jgi:organic radical activating enzyme
MNDFITLAEEPFYSLQGEGPNVGKPAVFIRFAECILKCKFCDSKHTWSENSYSHEKYLIDDLINIVNAYPAEYLVITGGEPLLNKNLKNLKNLIYELSRKTKINHISFETTFISEDKEEFWYSNFEERYLKVNELFSDFKEKIYIDYVISPKISADSIYSDEFNADTRQILTFYDWTNNIEIKENDRKKLFYKFIYNGEDEFLMEELIDTVPEEYKKNIFIMPLTPNVNIFSRKEYVKNCKLAANYCLENNLNYSPRIQIDIWENELRT